MTTKQQRILARYPKQRPALPAAYQEIYAQHYKQNRQGETQATSISMKMEQWLHRKVAEDVATSTLDISTLEIGAGTLNQLPYEPHIQTYDVIEPFTELYKKSPHQSRVQQFYSYIEDIPTSNRYQRITSVATFEHITNLPTVVAKAALLLAQNGTLRVSIPNEGTLLWRMGTMVTGFEFRRTYGLDYQVLMRHEHVNTAEEIEAVIHYFFEKR